MRFKSHSVGDLPSHVWAWYLQTRTDHSDSSDRCLLRVTVGQTEVQYTDHSRECCQQSGLTDQTGTLTDHSPA